MGMMAKARQARSLAASVCAAGTDIQAPSTKANISCDKALLSAPRPKGHTRVKFRTLMAVCAPGHALEVDAITQREALLAVRRQVSRDSQLRACAETLRRHA